MTPRKLDVFVAFFSYGGNGGISSEHPSIRDWWVKTVIAMKRDERVGKLYHADKADTPITMVRNQMVVSARAAKADVIMMVDSDQYPDFHLSDAGSKPFWDSSFEFLYNHYEKGPCMVGAPYCGPPPVECVYVFRWRNHGNQGLERDLRLDKFTREEAAAMGGIRPVACLPTGLLLIDMRMFEVLEPLDTKMPADHRGWFYYEYKDKYAAEKASTEDVVFTRDASLVGFEKLKYNPVYCNWDAWAGHWKPYCVGKPKPPTLEAVNEKFVRAVLSNRQQDERLEYVGDDEGDTQEASEPTPLDMNNPMHVLAFLGDDQGDSHNRDTLADLAAAAVLPGKPFAGVEVGTFIGHGANAICRGFQQGQLTCVDNFSGVINDGRGSVNGKISPDMIRECWSLNTRLNEGRCRLIETKSLDAVKQFDDGSLDFVYLDADHGYEPVKREIAAWLPKVRPGGIIAGHDYTNSFPGLKRAVNESFDRRDDIQLSRDVWIYRVPSNNGHAAPQDAEAPAYLTS